MTWTAPPVARIDEPLVADERTMLDAFLDWQRATLLLTCSGLTGVQLAQRALPASNLSLLGLVRHFTDVERTWFRRRFGGEEVDTLYGRASRPDAAFDDIDPDGAEEDLARLTNEQHLAREAVAGMSLDAVFLSERWGPMSLRWAYLQMTAKYARHNANAELIRQRIGGQTDA
jgi:hypothetical protein